MPLNITFYVIIEVTGGLVQTFGPYELKVRCIHSHTGSEVTNVILREPTNLVKYQTIDIGTPKVNFKFDGFQENYANCPITTYQISDSLTGSAVIPANFSDPDLTGLSPG